MAHKRKLAAIMFTDIVGYTTIMSKNEQEAMDLLQKNLDLQKSILSDCGGDLLKELGDGTLLYFDSLIDAVHCAIRIQNQSREVPGLSLRIGIHLGDVLFKDGDIFGDGVNIASRLEPFAPPGGICISEQVFQMIENKSEWQTDFIGTKKLKNVNRPLSIYSVQEKAVSTLPGKSGSKANMTTGKTIAVLPFTNMSNDSEQEYFCDGLTEDILNNLTYVDDLQVVSRTSSFALKGNKQNIQEVGHLLGAENIVDGSVRKAGNRLRISVQLIKVSDGFMLWSERYDRELKDIFEIQDEISLSIVQALKARLTKEEKKVIEKVTTENHRAYDFYIKGRHYYRTFHKNRFDLAINMFEKAIEIDSKYALAYAGLADCHSFIYLWFQGDQENLHKALATSQKALELDPDLAEAHISLGLALANTSDYQAAEDAFERAIELNPQLFEAYYQYGRACKEQGKNGQAIGLFEKAVQLRPDDYEVTSILAMTYDGAGRRKEAQDGFRKSAGLARKYLELNPEDTRALYLGASSLVVIGEREEARSWIEKAIALEPEEMGVLYNATCVYSQLGETDKALDLFEKTTAGGMINAGWIHHDTDLDPIRDHPRFQAVLRKFEK